MELLCLRGGACHREEHAARDQDSALFFRMESDNFLHR